MLACGHVASKRDGRLAMLVVRISLTVSQGAVFGERI
jgi:hypothetical protein